ncbi:aminotransferase class IV [Aquiflexum sp.]|uniref:aminotransferase class IV n=1 Tax=Aquiflexum sp. TaxID=1872584 RepID=UPI003592E96C
MNSNMIEINTVSLFKNKDSGWSETPDSFHNRAFLFGDGLFETMVFANGKLRFGEFHIERLIEGCRVLHLDFSSLCSIEILEKVLVGKFGIELTLRVRWNVYREGVGKYTPESEGLNESLQIQVFRSSPRIKEKAFFLDTVTVPKTFWSHCKTLNALTYVMANLEKMKNSMDEVILCNSDGYVSEAGSSNIFWIKDGTFFTPSLNCSCIAGIGRRLIIEKLKASSKSITEGKFLTKDVLEANFIFTSNVTGVSFIKEIEGKFFQTEHDFDLDF